MNFARRRLLAALPLLVAGTAICGSASALAHDGSSPWVSGGVAAIEVFDRSANQRLEVYDGPHGQAFVVGNPGNEYRLHIRNLTGARILAVASVDGVNIVSGETASPSQSGYVLGPWESLDIDGWRTSLQKTAAFYFTTLADSYATRTGRPNDLGVIGVAVFRERPRVMEYRPSPKVSRNEASQDAMGGMTAKRERADQAQRPESVEQDAAKPSAAAPSIGTGYGRDEWSSAQRVTFERATSSPAEVLSVRYDRRENLIAMGVLPRPRVIGRAPDPFPGSFVAPPYR
ncbi:MAG: hypothetical protein ABI881_01125 [Betaproteobacteria bacterium]